MINIMQVIMSDGKIMGIPAEIIADNYAKHYENGARATKKILMP